MSAPAAQVTSKLLSEEGAPLMAYLFTYDDFKKSDQHMSNPYGLLRAPWNYNPSGYLTRFNNLNGRWQRVLRSHANKKK